MSSLPKEPGVYWFKDSKRKILYIGKAKNLRNRLASYKRSAVGPSPALQGKTKLLINQTRWFQFVILESELQALILEAKLIKTYTPKYNIRLKDDRSPLYIVITREPFNRVFPLRKTQIFNSQFSILNSYGPFPSGYQTRRIVKILRHIFPFCNNTPQKKKLSKACFYSHINLCSGACTGKVSQRQYRAMIRQLADFLSGNEAKVVKSLTGKLRAQAKNRDYETAAKTRDQLALINELKQKRLGRAQADELEAEVSRQSKLQSLKMLLKIKGSLKRIEAYDISTLQGKHSTGSMVVFINGQSDTNQYRHFRIRKLQTANDVAMMGQVVSRRLKHPEWGKPNLIIVDGGKPQVNAVKKEIATLRPLPFALSLQRIPVIGLAKRQEQLIIANKTIDLPRNSPALRLVQSIRDESHRFARRLHHKLRHRHLLPK